MTERGNIGKYTQSHNKDNYLSGDGEISVNFLIASRMKLMFQIAREAKQLDKGVKDDR